MSERTTIGGTVYETVGSSTSNLLLRCNGTARIQWGTKLIDLVKNGKIASGDSSAQISVVSNESDIKTDGIYVINAEKSSRLIIRKNSENYDFTDTELYISANNKQELTVEQQKQAMENIGMYYDTLDDVEKSGIQNGIVYVLEDRSLYTIKDGVILEFEAKLKTVSVEKENEDGERINSSVQVVLSVLDTDYIVLRDKKVNVKQTISMSPYASIESEHASNVSGYRIYMQDGQSYLEIDNIIQRNVKEKSEYIEVSVSELRSLIKDSKLEPSKWYVLTNYCNPWKLFKSTIKPRPLFLQALRSDKLYPEGFLYNDRSVSIKYDPFFDTEVNSNSSRGLITWMKDSNGNEANFDFLDIDPTDSNKTLHILLEDKGDYFIKTGYSIFPRNSYNNKLTISNFNTCFSGDSLNLTIDFGILDSSNLGSLNKITKEDLQDLPIMEMHDNNIECYGISITVECDKFINNTIKNCGILKFNSDCYSNTLLNVYNNTASIISDDLSSMTLTETIFNKEVSDVTIKACSNSIIRGSLIRSFFDYITLSTINSDIANSSFKDISNCTINATCNKVTFSTLNTCTIGEGTLESLTCRSDLASLSIDSVNHALLYDTTRIKDVYYVNGQFQIIDSASSGFPSGMIVMHSGNSIPEGWAPCDGNEYEYQGQKYRTPNLVGRFIKAVDKYSDIGEGNVHNNGSSNEFTLGEHHLPAHTHPHSAHTHTISNITGTLGESGDLSLSSNIEYMTTTEVTTVDVIPANSEELTSVIDGIEDIKSVVGVSGGNHTHELTISGGSTDETISTESEKIWSNQSFKIEPNYYSLIFIMKL